MLKNAQHCPSLLSPHKTVVKKKWFGDSSGKWQEHSGDGTLNPNKKPQVAHLNLAGMVQIVAILQRADVVLGTMIAKCTKPGSITRGQTSPRTRCTTAEAGGRRQTELSVGSAENATEL